MSSVYDFSNRAIEDLANGIVVQAALDLKNSLMDLKRNPFDRSAREMLNDTIRFFFSNWYSKLTTVDPLYIINRIRNEVKEWDELGNKKGVKRSNKNIR